MLVRELALALPEGYEGQARPLGLALGRSISLVSARNGSQCSVGAVLRWPKAQLPGDRCWSRTGGVDAQRSLACLNLRSLNSMASSIHSSIRLRRRS